MRRAATIRRAREGAWRVAGRPAHPRRPRSRGVENRLRITYDEINQRVRILDEVHAGTPGRTFYERIILHRSNVQYTLNLSARPPTCTIGKPEMPWRAWKIPENATFVGAFTIGVLGDGLEANMWSERDAQGRWIGITVTERHCVPVSLVEAHNISYSVSSSYYDVVIGLPNPNVFIPPQFCK